jgi:hypothetical protein
MKIYQQPPIYCCSTCGVVLSLFYPEHPPKDHVVLLHRGNYHCPETGKTVKIVVTHMEGIPIENETV